VKRYFRKLANEFDDPSALVLRIMKSNGGFDRAEVVRASQLLLSGPAGGLIGCQAIIPLLEEASQQPINSTIEGI